MSLDFFQQGCPSSPRPNRRVRAAICTGLLMLAGALIGHAADWPMLGHDAARSGATPDEMRPPFSRKWYRLFTEEGLMTGIQPIVVDGKVYVGTLHGSLHALDTETGKDVWSFKAGGAILHSVAAGNSLIIFGATDGYVYAVNATSGQLAWKIRTGAAVWNAPVFSNGTVYIGSRDCQLYAIDTVSGQVKWTSATGGPLLCSPALDEKRGRVYIGSEDMHVYAFDLRDGGLAWKSPKLPGVSLRGYHPVIAPDGAIMITSMPSPSVDTFQGVLLDMVKAVFGDFASWRHKKEENDKIRAENFRLMEKPETYTAQLDYLRKRLTEQPAYQTFFVLDPETGTQRFVAPIVYGESMNGPQAPAVVTPDGKVIVKYQALLRSRYEHYSPFMNVGYLDTVTGNITPVMDQSRTYGWHESLLLVHDEQSQLVVGGNVLVNTHQDNVNGLDLATREGFKDPFARNIHEPQKGEAIGIWTGLLRGETLPVGKEWLPRGTAVYGGGSVLDVPVSIAGDSFYFLPTHEISAGVGVIAYRMGKGSVAENVKTSGETLTTAEWRTIEQMPWDWDTLEMARLDHVLAATPGKVPGTRSQSLIEEATKHVARISDERLDRYIWEACKSPAPAQQTETRGQTTSAQLNREIRELVSHSWRPLLFPSGKHPEEAYRFFTDPIETLYTVSLAFPFLDAEIQNKARDFVAQMVKPGGVLQVATGRRTYDSKAGEIRSAYEHPPEHLLKVKNDIARNDLARLYPLWLWANVAGDWSTIEKSWPTLRELARAEPGKMEEDCHNGYMAGLVAYCRIAEHMKDTAAVNDGLTITRKALRERLVFELSHTRGGLIWNVPTNRSIFARWNFLTPEIGRLLREQAGDIHRRLMAAYVDYHRPTWWLAWNAETMMRNEAPLELPTMSAQVFAARSLILGEPPEQLCRYLDQPWCKADEFFIQKLALTLHAAGSTQWGDVRDVH